MLGMGSRSHRETLVPTRQTDVSSSFFVDLYRVTINAEEAGSTSNCGNRAPSHPKDPVHPKRYTISLKHDFVRAGLETQKQSCSE